MIWTIADILFLGIQINIGRKELYLIRLFYFLASKNFIHNFKQKV